LAVKVARGSTQTPQHSGFYGKASLRRLKPIKVEKCLICKF